MGIQAWKEIVVRLRGLEKERLSSISAKRKIMWSRPKQMEQKGEHKTVPKEAC